MTNELEQVEEPKGSEERVLAQEAQERLVEHIERAEVEQARDLLDALPPGETAWALSHLDSDVGDRLFETLAPEDAAHLLECVPDVQAADLIERIDPRLAAAIIEELPSADQADLLGEIEDEEADAILAQMAPAGAAAARKLTSYAPNVAGGLMAAEVICFRDGQTCGQVVAELRRRADELKDFGVQYAYVVDAGERLVGVLRLRDLLFAPDASRVTTVMIHTPMSVPDVEPLDRLAAFFDQHSLLGAPVVDAAGRVLGIVHRSAVEEALGERAEGDYLKSQGIVGGEELRSMPLKVRARRRLSWLSINIVLNVVAASVIAMYEDTLSAAIALVVFIPILSDMSGCSGSQAVAVSIRELALGVVKPFELFSVWVQELKVGVLNGAALGTLLALVAWLWKGNPWLGLVVGVALALNTVIAVSVGGIVPLVLKRAGRDPALAAGPILTTVTDVCGFFLVLSLATLLLPKLAGG